MRYGVLLPLQYHPGNSCDGGCTFPSSTSRSCIARDVLIVYRILLQLFVGPNRDTNLVEDAIPTFGDHLD